MKRTILILVVCCLVISASTSAEIRDFKGQSWISGNLGYAVGSGDLFSSYTEPISNTKFSFGPGVGFGGQFYYGVKSNLLIGGELILQSYTAKISSPANLALSLPANDISESQIESNFIVNSMFNVNQTKSSDLFLMAGTGFYDFGGMELGLNSGIFWRKKMSPTVHIFAMPRVHVVMADTTPMMFQFTMGAQFSL